MSAFHPLRTLGPRLDVLVNVVNGSHREATLERGAAINAFRLFCLIGPLPGTSQQRQLVRAEVAKIPERRFIRAFELIAQNGECRVRFADALRSQQ